MELLNELSKLSDSLQQQRDELRLQIHLAGAELKDEWEKNERQWDHFKEKFADIVDEGQETTTELLEKTRIIGEELTTAYKNIRRRLSSS